MYKLVAKVLANRLKVVLAYVISLNQSAFIPNRLITDNIIVAFEVLHSLCYKYTGNEGWFALKLDMSKAYDRVEWGFLKKMLLRMKFSVSFIELIMNCVSTVEYSVVLNGTALPSLDLK